MDADQQLLRRVGTGLRAGLNVIVDGKSFAVARDRLALDEIVEDAGGRLVWVWLDVSLELAIARVSAQAGDHPAADRDEALVRAVAARFEPFTTPVWRIDASLDPEQVEQDLKKRLAGYMRAILFEE